MPLFGYFFDKKDKEQTEPSPKRSETQTLSPWRISFPAVLECIPKTLRYLGLYAPTAYPKHELKPERGLHAEGEEQIHQRQDAKELAMVAVMDFPVPSREVEGYASPDVLGCLFLPVLT